MRHTILVIILATAAYVPSASAQSMVEAGAAAAGGSVGGAAGKKVSEGVTSILGNLDKTTKKAAASPSKTDAATAEPLFQVGPGVPRADPSSVPPPPPPAHRAGVPKAAPAPPPAPEAIAPPAPPAPPPPPPVTAADLKGLTVGTNRADVLKLGPTSSRITMFEDGHLIEVYRYSANNSMVGVVRLTDGTVSSVQTP